MIDELKNLLTCLNSVGIDTIVLEQNDDGDNTRVRGTDPNGSIVVFDTVNISSMSEHPIAIQSVSALLSRLKLFSSDASIELKDDGECVTTITVKEGRKKVTYRCDDPNNRGLPTRSIDDLSIRDDNSISMSHDRVSELVRAIQSISQTGTKENQTISFHVREHDASVTIYDGEADSFNDVIEDVAMKSSDKVSWEVKSFNKVMKKSAEDKDEVTFGVSEYGTATFNIGNLVDAVVVPFA